MNLNRKKIINWAKWIIIIYCLIGIALYYLQDTFLFHPKKLETGHVFTFDQPFEELFIPMNSTDTISMVKFFPKDSMRKGVVVYYHGNMSNIEHYARFAENFTKHGYEVWMEDYPGFGKSRGERNEKKIYEQAIQVLKMASSKYKADSIIIYGKSFGTGIASYVASLSDCKRLILETPYYSIPDLFNTFSLIYPAGYMSNYQIPTFRYIDGLTTPVTIFQGTNDWVVPYRCAARLKKKLKPADEFISIPGGTHNNLNDFKEYHYKLDSLLNL